ISGRTTTKAPVDLLNMTPSLTQFYVEEPSTKNRGGFAISGRTTTKEGEADILTVTPNLTQVYVNETTTKNRGGFAISGRTTTKESGTYDVLTVVPERTDVYVKPSPGKNSLPIGFGVHGLDDSTFETTEFFSISGAGTYVATSLAVKPTVVTGLITDRTQTSAFGAGTVTDKGGTDVEITASGIVYNIGTTLPTLENVSGITPGEGGVVSGGESTDFNNLEMENLTPGTAYKVRAFATNSDGLTGYGLPKEFSTDPAHKITINVTDGTDPITTMVTFWKQGAQEPVSISSNNSTHMFGLTKGTYAYKVEAIGYQSKISSEYEVKQDKTEVVVLSPIESGSYSVNFIAENQYNNPVSNVRISVASNSDLTNSAGEATLNLPTGESTYSITVPEGYDNIQDGTILVAEINLPVEISLMKQHKVTFIVKSPNGTPTEWAQVMLTKAEGQESAEIYVSNGVGETFLPSDADGVWNYEVYAGDESVTGTITVGEDNVIETVKLKAPLQEFTVRYRIEDNESVAIEGARVHLEADGIFDEVLYSNSAGEVTFTKVKAILLPDSEYTLTIEKDGFGIHTESFEINQYSQEYDPENPGTFNVKTIGLITVYTVKIHAYHDPQEDPFTSVELLLTNVFFTEEIITEDGYATFYNVPASNNAYNLNYFPWLGETAYSSRTFDFLFNKENEVDQENEPGQAEYILDFDASTNTYNIELPWLENPMP
ncbi:MAG: hypothetical protein RBR40_14520, partial [Tenuifilaceae bacterium]|nr:hypothetical protein [Tenuifilaceae bacterium]